MTIICINTSKKEGKENSALETPLTHTQNVILFTARYVLFLLSVCNSYDRNTSVFTDCRKLDICFSQQHWKLFIELYWCDLYAYKKSTGGERLDLQEQSSEKTMGQNVLSHLSFDNSSRKWPSITQVQSASGVTNVINQSWIDWQRFAYANTC